MLRKKIGPHLHPPPPFFSPAKKSVKSVGFCPKCVTLTCGWKASSIRLCCPYRHAVLISLGLGRGMKNTDYRDSLRERREGDGVVICVCREGFLHVLETCFARSSLVSRILFLLYFNQFWESWCPLLFLSVANISSKITKRLCMYINSCRYSGVNKYHFKGDKRRMKRERNI